MGEQQWTLEISWLGRPHLMNAERRLNHWTLRRIHRDWRQAGCQAATISRLPRPMPPCAVTVRGRYKLNRLPDPDALAPSVKCVLDGIVDRGCWPDDTSASVLSVTYLPPLLDRSQPDALLLTLTAQVPA